MVASFDDVWQPGAYVRREGRQDPSVGYADPNEPREKGRNEVSLAIEGLCPLLQVFDMPTSLRFYRDVLGFAEVQKSGEGDVVDWAWLRHGTADLMLNTAYEADRRPASPDAARVQSHADTTLFFGCDDLDAAYVHLTAQGVKASPPKVAPYGMRQLSLSDPDGYGLCFQHPVR
jgi:catechol 2,3-dioxygenase-like lactoylglutathione lyase family enzyme